MRSRRLRRRAARAALEQRLGQLTSVAPPARPVGVGLTTFSFAYEQTDVPPGQTLTEYRKARRR